VCVRTLLFCSTLGPARHFTGRDYEWKGESSRSIVHLRMISKHMDGGRWIFLENCRLFVCWGEEKRERDGDDGEGDERWW
jgi:hypothetical protein